MNFCTHTFAVNSWRSGNIISTAMSRYIQKVHCGQNTASTCLIGDEESELLCLELLWGVAILSEAILLQLSSWNTTHLTLTSRQQDMNVMVSSFINLFSCQMWEYVAALLHSNTQHTHTSECSITHIWAHTPHPPGRAACHRSVIHYNISLLIRLQAFYSCLVFFFFQVIQLSINLPVLNSCKPLVCQWNNISYLLIYWLAASQWLSSLLWAWAKGADALKCPQLYSAVLLMYPI